MSTYLINKTVQRLVKQAATGAGYGGLRGLLKPGEAPSSKKLAIAALLAAALNRITL